MTSPNAKESARHSWTLTFDGGASPNPGIASCAFKAVSNAGKVIEDHWKMEGIRTNNEAEWDAVATGIEQISRHDPDARFIKVIGDSELVINQLSGLYKVKNHKLRPFNDRVAKIKKQGIRMAFYHVKREFNTEMDAACKSARGYKGTRLTTFHDH